MIVAAYGLPGVTILELTFMLNQLKLSYGVVVDSKLEIVEGLDLGRAKVAVFESMKMFDKTRSKFKVPRVVALIVDDPFVLAKENGVTLLGAEMKATKCTFTSFTAANLKTHLIEGSCKTTEVQFEFDKVKWDPVPNILRSYNASSLSSIQTQLYRIKDTSQRKEVGDLVRKFFSTRASYSSLQSSLQKVTAQKTAEAFVALLSTPEMRVLRSVVQAAAANPSKLKSLAKKKKISPFDVKYLLVTGARK